MSARIAGDHRVDDGHLINGCLQELGGHRSERGWLIIADWMTLRRLRPNFSGSLFRKWNEGADGQQRQPYDDGLGKYAGLPFQHPANVPIHIAQRQAHSAG